MGGEGCCTRRLVSKAPTCSFFHLEGSVGGCSVLVAVTHHSHGEPLRGLLSAISFFFLYCSIPRL